ncbi:Cif family virulence factor [Dongia rigui]|uniref:SnoaL-like domain-containing protein n=1 Tax=Dongia rigui TaxID=940149 RepID=A0ABU5DVD9_9PROT|nr:hypothetical protein [Dongia rigui]MDY0870905.1 hypothetical protein [Dongia rigui]
MTEYSAHAPVYDPQELEWPLVARQHAGDVESMTALFEADAVIDCGDGKFIRRRGAIRTFHVEIAADGRKFAMGEQRPALICRDLAMTSTRLRWRRHHRSRPSPARWQLAMSNLPLCGEVTPTARCS